MKPKLLVPIVSRTNYSKLRSIILKLDNCQDIDVTVLLSSGIVPRKLTDGARDIYEDGINIFHEIDCLLTNDTLESMVKSLGISIIDHATTLSKVKPSGVLVVGDRYDMFSPVITSLIMNIPIFHIQGGELSGTIDDTIRDLITLCSVRHYASTEKSSNRIKSLVGDNGVYNTGCPAVEYIANIPITKELHVETFHKHFKDTFDLQPGEPYFIIIAHPDTTNSRDIDMNLLLDTSFSFNYKCVIIYPNVDAYREQIVQSIRRHKDKAICISHAPLEDFVQLMAHSYCMIGNSSSGIREAASFKIPVVNVGQRQRNRERNHNIIDVDCNEKDIRNGISNAIKMNLSGENIYYKRGSADFICKNVVEYLLENT